MAEVAFVFIDAVFRAVEPPLFLQLRVAEETAIFISVVFRAPEAFGVSLGSVANEAAIAGRTGGGEVNFDVAAGSFFGFVVG
jgi:hypothetical protein